MNCKPGDLAMVIRSAAGNEGAIVRCVHLVPAVFHATFNYVGPAWRLDRALKTVSGFGAFPDMAMDDCLRPIRDPGDDAQDETLQWLPVPSQHKEHA